MPPELTWDDTFLPPSTSISEHENKAREYRRLQEQKRQIDAKLKALAADLTQLFPEDETEASLDLGSLTVHMKRSETWKWDQAVLAKMADASTSIVAVKMQLTIPREVYESLPVAEQDKLAHALTRIPRTPTFTVTNNPVPK